MPKYGRSDKEEPSLILSIRSSGFLLIRRRDEPLEIDAEPFLVDQSTTKS